MSIRAATETTNLGRYHVVKRLAKGGMADVLLARTIGVAGFERHVVIKRIHPELGDEPRYRKMFLDEARLAASLHHHNIVQVNDIGEHAGEYFFAMEYVHGEDARRLLIEANKRGQLIPLEHVITIAMGAAAGLHHAHDQKGPDKRPLHIVHRDVSPANILVGYDGGVKVADFGIAFAANRAEQTQSGVLKGKASYMSPEQCNCEPVDRRSDVFSLGIVLYELCTVHPCFTGENDFLTMKSIVSGTYVPPTQLNAAIPPELAAIIVKALAPRPDDRFATCDELRRALEQFAEAQGMRTSTTALADYMKQQFGTRPEPWLEEGAPTDEAEIEITGSSPLDLVLELKLPDPEPEDDLAVPIETTPQVMAPLQTPQGSDPLPRPQTVQARPIKSTLPMRALKLVPPTPATVIEVGGEPSIIVKEETPVPQFPRPDTERVRRIKRAWLVASVVAVIAAALAFAAVSRRTTAPIANAPTINSHEDLDLRVTNTSTQHAPPSAPTLPAQHHVAPAPAPTTTAPAKAPAPPPPATPKKFKKWDPDALFPK